MRIILILCLISTTCFGQQFTLQDGTKILIPEEFWKNAIHVNVSTPKEIQFAPGTQVKFIILEVPNGGKTIWLGEKGDTEPTDPKPDITKDIDNLPGIGLTYFPTTNLGLNVFNASGWYHFQSTSTITWPNPAFNKSFSVLMVPGHVEIDIVGYKFEWFTEKRINHGIASVSVDGIKVADVDLYANRMDNNSQMVYTWEDPAKVNKAHKVRISFTGNKNTAATENNIIHDYLKVYSKQ